MAEKTKTKSEREKDNKEKSIQNRLEKENLIREHEQKKSVINEGLEKSYSLVFNTLEQLESVKDIDPYWISKKYSLEFISYIPDDNQESSISEESLLIMNHDLSKLLKFKYNVFWSHVLLNQTLQEFLDSYLRFFDRLAENKINILDQNPTGTQSDVSRDLSEILSKLNLGDTNKESYQVSKLMLYKRVFFILLRISMQFEKSGQFLTKEYYSKLIHANKIFTIPKLFDIASIYIPINQNNILNEMFQRIFDLQPLYYTDLIEQSNNITKVLSDLKNTLLQSNLDLIKLEDSSKYINDIFYTLDCFMIAYPTGTHTLYNTIAGENKTLFFELLSTYYSVILKYFTTLLPKSWSVSVKESFYNPIKRNILSLLHSMFNHLFIHPINAVGNLHVHPCDQCRSNNTISLLVEGFLSVIGTIINLTLSSDQSKQTKSFNEFIKSGSTANQLHLSDILLDYDKKYQLSDYLSNLKSLYKDVDEYQLSFILQFFGKQISISSSNNSSNKSTPPPASTKNISNADMEKIKNVKELFPELGNYFVQSCLKFYNQDVEKVVNALFDDSTLPPHLKSMDRQLNTDPKQIEQSNTSTPISTTTTTTSTSRNAPLKISFNDSSDVQDRLNRARANLYVSKYEEMYNDEYDDSLEEFTGVQIQDGEQFNKCDDQDELDDEISLKKVHPLTDNGGGKESAPHFVAGKQSSKKPHESHKQQRPHQPKQQSGSPQKSHQNQPKQQQQQQHQNQQEQPQQPHQQTHKPSADSKKHDYKKKSHNQKDASLKKRGV